MLRSEDIQTVVLNSFALTIFIEIDDLANVFESDEAYLLQEDGYGMKRMRMKGEGWWKVCPPDRKDHSGVRKREIGGKWTGYKRIQLLIKFRFSPFYESFKILLSLVDMCCCCKNRSNKSVEVQKNPPVTCDRVLLVSRAQDCYGYHIGFVALSLQILLCIGITIDSVNQWLDTSLEDLWDTIISLEYELEDVLIVIISTLTFAFILQRLSKAINSFKRFYRNIKEVCIIPPAVIALDFTSNVVVGTWMAMITPFFLLQSEDIQTVVLNSFALTIFIELDDLANVFESDEAYLSQEDWHGMEMM